MKSSTKIKVLVVDDSALVRKILSDGLSKDPVIEVIGAAPDPYRARDILVVERPDVITLDVEMPKMDGVTFLRKYMAVYPTPTIMVSSLTSNGKRITIEALEAGAVDVVTKPEVGVADELPRMLETLREKVKAAASVRVRRRSEDHRVASVTVMHEVKALDESTDKVIAIGASTGGTEALARILPAFPPATPGIVVVQHMPAGFTASFASRLDSLCAMEVREAAGGERVRPGLILIAPGGERHMKIRRSGGQYLVALESGDKVSGHRPSVDEMFSSVAGHAGKNAVAALLTGMGRDGAEGLLEIRKAGGRTVAQDEATSVVFGMPKAAWENGGAERLLSLEEIPAEIMAGFGPGTSKDSRITG